MTIYSAEKCTRKKNTLHDLRFSQWYWWGLRSSKNAVSLGECFLMLQRTQYLHGHQQ